MNCIRRRNFNTLLLCSLLAETPSKAGENIKLYFFYIDTDGAIGAEIKKEYLIRFPAAIYTSNLEEVDVRSQSALICTFGPQALRMLTESDVAGKLNASVVALHINREVFYNLAPPMLLAQKRVGAIFNDTSVDSQFKLIHSVFGNKVSVLVPLSYKTQKYRYEIIKSGQSFGFNLIIKAIDTRGNVTKSFVGLPSADVLLMYPDLDIYTPYNLSSILESCYRRNMPAIGFNPAIVNAGALGATFANPADIANGLNWLININREGLHPIHPPYWRSIFNERIARSLGIVISSESINLSSLVEIKK